MFVCLSSPALAFRGRVVDREGKPVPNATVSILGRTGEAITDQDGRFVWQPDPPTPFEILVIDAAGTYSRPIMIETLDAAVGAGGDHRADSQRVGHRVRIRAEHRVHAGSGAPRACRRATSLFDSRPT